MKPISYLSITLFCLACSSASQPALYAEDVSIKTWHGNNDRNGLNSAEQLLAHSNVNSGNFGKVGFFATDGIVDAEPLHMAGVKIGGGVHNVVYAATEHDSVYAFEAGTGAVLWKTSLLESGETPSDNHSCSQISPEIGITSTPVIDPSRGPNGVMYVVNMTKDTAGKYHQRINALDITTGGQVLGGPTEIAASYPGTGDNSSNGKVVFDPAQYAERAGLLEWNGAIYTAWTSHCDIRPYTGWILGYDASTLEQTSVLNVTPNGSEGSVWMSGAGLAAGQTKIYLLDANGTFDTTLDSKGFPNQQDYGNAVLALTNSGSGLKVVDYYATDNTVQESNSDVDLGSGGILLLPTMTDGSGNAHNLAVCVWQVFLAHLWQLTLAHLWQTGWTA